MITLPVLEGRVRGCTACTAARPPAFRVLGDGPVDARIVLVGEAPGATEEAEARPFVGDAGQELDRWLPRAPAAADRPRAAVGGGDDRGGRLVVDRARADDRRRGIVEVLRAAARFVEVNSPEPKLGREAHRG